MKNIIAIDIGGTNCRIGHFCLSKNILVLKHTLWIKTTDLKNSGEIIDAMINNGIRPEKIDAFIHAIAGCPEGSMKGQLTNASLKIDFEEILPNLTIINDFVAQAYAIINNDGEKTIKIAGIDNLNLDESATRAIIGAGTGLGYSILIKNKTSSSLPYTSLHSENGHAVFPFTGEKENKFQNFICKELKIPFATGDDVLSGRGLAALHYFFSGKKLKPSEIGNNFLNHENETLVQYSRFYARACRNWMLSTVCTGGLWITGGIAIQNPFVIQNSHFLAELYNSPGWEKFLSEIPVYLVTDQNNGLWGAARYAQHNVIKHKKIICKKVQH